MRSAILAFLAGACWLQTRAELPTLTSMAVACAAALVLCALRRHIAIVLACALFGAAWASLLAGLALDDSLPRDLEGKDVAIVGTVDSLPHEFDGGVRFNMRVEDVLTPDATVPRKIAVSWYGQAQAPALSSPVAPGERWQLVVRLQRPHGNANPYGFDYEAWLLEEGVRATGYVRPAGARNLRRDAFVPRFGHVVERSRAALRRHILQQLEGRRYAGVIVALVIGDQRGIPQWWCTPKFCPEKCNIIKDLQISSIFAIHKVLP
jgi:competence protein ComEC